MIFRSAAVTYHHCAIYVHHNVSNEYQTLPRTVVINDC